MTAPVASKTPPPDSRPPSGPPPDNRPPNRPPSNPPPTNPPPTTRLAAELDTASLLLRSIGVLRLPGMDPAARMQLAHGLAVAQRAVADVKTPARRDHQSRAGTPAIATTGALGGARPRAAARAGGPPAPGAGSKCDNPWHDSMPSRRDARCPFCPDAGFDLPKALMVSLSRRAD